MKGVDLKGQSGTVGRQPTWKRTKYLSAWTVGYTFDDD